MAGDWIPVRHDLEEEPEVVQIVSAICPQSVRNLSARMRNVTLVVGALQRTWRLFDMLTDDGKLVGYTAEWLDAHVGIENWSHNLQQVGWLEVGAQSLVMPRFTTWLGQSAKRRLKDSQRKKAVRNLSTESVRNARTSVRNFADKKRTTEQKRTEQNRTKKTSSSRHRKFSDADFATAAWMHEQNLILQPGRKKPNLDTWANDVRLMRERDGHADAEIRGLYQWCHNDPFWRLNILSPAKLRQKWDDLQLRKDQPHDKKQDEPRARAYDPNKPVRPI